MSAVPTSPLAPGDSGYSAVYNFWVAQGRGRFVERQADGWLREVTWPDATASQPTFLLVCSAAGETSQDLDTPTSGYGREMATAQSSWRGNRTLSKQAV